MMDSSLDPGCLSYSKKKKKKAQNNRQPQTDNYLLRLLGLLCEWIHRGF